MKVKILSLSNDNRNFLRAPPSGVTFEFDYNSVSATALALLQEDPQLEKMRYELVPKSIKEDEFWRNYFYRVNLIKQSFDLKDLESSSSPSKAEKPSTKVVKEQNNHQESEEIVDNSGKYVNYLGRFLPIEFRDFFFFFKNPVKLSFSVNLTW